EHGHLTGEGAYRDRGLGRARATEENLLVISSPTQIECVAWLQLPQGMSQRSPGQFLRSGGSIVAARRIDKPLRPVRWFALHSRWKGAHRRMRAICHLRGRGSIVGDSNPRLVGRKTEKADDEHHADVP